MQTWIFQGNPDGFDIDGYLASRPTQVSWLVTRFANDIAIGDRVYLWRNQGSARGIAGIVSECIVTAPTAMRDEDPEGVDFWRQQDERRSQPQPRALLRIVKVANSREVLRSKWCEEDPVLNDLPNLKMRNATNYKISPNHAARIAALWARTGRDWNRNESIAGLWAYAETYGGAVSSLPDSPVSRVALLVGRAVSGVYAKVMNFRSLDPRADGKGMTGAGETDRLVWQEFFNTKTTQLDSESVRREFSRLWDIDADVAESEIVDAAVTTDAEAEAGHLEEQTLEQLLARYAAQQAGQPKAGHQSGRQLERQERGFMIAIR